MKTKGEMSREKILETACELFKTKGFTATTVTDLVGATGMQKGSIYFHFSGKEELAREVLGKTREDLGEFLSCALSGPDPGACLDHYLACTLEKHLATGFVGGCIIGNTALEMSDFHPEFSGAIDRIFDEWISRVATTVADAQKAGQIRDDLGSETLARQIIATIEGGIMMSRLKKDDQPLRECLDALRVTLELRR
jgi:TetR/AcrR family transcriptional repressor of nem operon